MKILPKPARPANRGATIGVCGQTEPAREWYRLFADIITPNHVHILLGPCVRLQKTTKSLKGRTARVCNRIPGRKGVFWQDESHDYGMTTARASGVVGSAAGEGDCGG